MSLLPIVNDDRGSLTPVSTPEAKRPKSVVKSILRSPIYSAPISRSSSCRLGSDPQASLPGTVEALRRLNIRPVSSSNGGGTGSNDIKPTESSRSNVHCRDSVRSASRALRSNSRPPPERSKDVNRRFRHHSCPPERTRVRFGFSQAREYERARGRDEHPNAGPFAIALGDRYVTAPPIAIPTEDELLRKQRNTDRVGMSAFKNMPTAEQKCRLLIAVRKRELLEEEEAAKQAAENAKYGAGHQEDDESPKENDTKSSISLVGGRKATRTKRTKSSTCNLAQCEDVEMKIEQSQRSVVGMYVGWLRVPRAHRVSWFAALLSTFALFLYGCVSSKKSAPSLRTVTAFSYTTRTNSLSRVTVAANESNVTSFFAPYAPVSEIDYDAKCQQSELATSGPFVRATPDIFAESETKIMASLLPCTHDLAVDCEPPASAPAKEIQIPAASPFRAGNSTSVTCTAVAIYIPPLAVGDSLEFGFETAFTKYIMRALLSYPTITPTSRNGRSISTALALISDVCPLHGPLASNYPLKQATMMEASTSSTALVVRRVSTSFDICPLRSTTLASEVSTILISVVIPNWTLSSNWLLLFRPSGWYGLVCFMFILICALRSGQLSSKENRRKQQRNGDVVDAEPCNEDSSCEENERDDSAMILFRPMENPQRDSDSGTAGGLNKNCRDSSSSGGVDAELRMQKVVVHSMERSPLEPLNPQQSDRTKFALQHPSAASNKVPETNAKQFVGGISPSDQEASSEVMLPEEKEAPFADDSGASAVKAVSSDDQGAAAPCDLNGHDTFTTSGSLSNSESEEEMDQSDRDGIVANSEILSEEKERDDDTPCEVNDFDAMSQAGQNEVFATSAVVDTAAGLDDRTGRVSASDGPFDNSTNERVIQPNAASVAPDTAACNVIQMTASVVVEGTAALLSDIAPEEQSDLDGIISGFEMLSEEKERDGNTPCAVKDFDTMPQVGQNGVLSASAVADTAAGLGGCATDHVPASDGLLSNGNDGMDAHRGLSAVARLDMDETTDVTREAALTLLSILNGSFGLVDDSMGIVDDGSVHMAQSFDDFPDMDFDESMLEVIDDGLALDRAVEPSLGTVAGELASPSLHVGSVVAVTTGQVPVAVHTTEEVVLHTDAAASSESGMATSFSIDRNEPIVSGQTVTTSNTSTANRPGDDLDTDFSAHTKPLYFLKSAVQDALSDFCSFMDTTDMVSKIERATSVFQATREYSIPSGTSITEKNGLFVAEMKKDRAKVKVGTFRSSGEATMALHHIENFLNERDDVIVGHGAVMTKQKHGEKWKSQIRAGGKPRSIGYHFLTEEEAQFAYFIANEKISKLSAARFASITETELNPFFAAVVLHVIQVYRRGHLVSE